MATVFELPDKLDLPEADSSQPEDAATCDVLAEAAEVEVEAEEESTAGEPSAEIDPAIIADQAEQAVEHQVPPKPATVAVTPYPPGWSSIPFYEYESELLERIREAAAECRRAACRIESLKADMKEAKGAHEKALLDLQQICSEVSKPAPACSIRQTTPPSQPIQYDSTQPPFGGLVESPPIDESSQEPAASSTNDTDQDDLAWRSVPITDLDLSKIRGLGTKKREALLDLCPTLGALEDLRAKVGRDAASLPELMPKGIGQQACDQLEELLLDWLAKRPVSIQELATSDDVTSAVGTDGLSHEDQVSQRAAELDDGQPNCLACKQSDDTLWKGGYRAFEDGFSLWDCPWTAGENQDEWLRGYLAAKAVTLYEGEQPESSTTTADDLDSL